MRTAGGCIVFKTLVALVAVLVVIAGCSAAASPPAGAPTSAAAPLVTATASSITVPTAAPTTAPAPAETPSTFASVVYPYSIALPAGWHAGAALLKWDGVSQPGHEEPTVDKFGGPISASVWAFAGSTKLDLKGFVKDRIAANFRDHADTCNAAADVTEPVKVGDDAAILLAWDCGILIIYGFVVSQSALDFWLIVLISLALGILINQVVLVHDGIAFAIAMRDLQVHAATDPADRAALDTLLAGITFSR